MSTVRRRPRIIATLVHVPIQVILASQSPSRRETLERAGIEPRVHIADVDEAAILASVQHRCLEEKVCALATAKARRCFDELYSKCRPQGTVIIIGCDSMFLFEGELCGKPHDPVTACARIAAMAGKKGVLMTGHHVIVCEGNQEIRQKTAASQADVYVSKMTSEEIQAYVDSGEPLEVAGSFTLEGLGGAFIDRVDGDYHGVIGLSLPLLRTMLKELDVFWPDLWTDEAKQLGGGAQREYHSK
ncbi:MAG: Maf family protein [Actinomycetaceae bacterium]|nr:Maf family protein [Actinomycetaceae bacterium]